MNGQPVYEFEILLPLGPFIVNEDRARVIDFTFPVYIDDLLGIIPFKVERDSAVIIRPFGWRVWLAVLGVTPLYLLSVWLADMIYKVGQMVVNYYFFVGTFSHHYSYYVRGN